MNGKGRRKDFADTEDGTKVLYCLTFLPVGHGYAVDRELRLTSEVDGRLG